MAAWDLYPKVDGFDSRRVHYERMKMKDIAQQAKRVAHAFHAMAVSAQLRGDLPSYRHWSALAAEYWNLAQQISGTPTN